jgi:hypothetical protein
MSSNGTVRGVTLADGTAVAADTVVTTVHPRRAFLDLIDRAELPPEFVADIESWQSRSGTSR